MYLLTYTYLLTSMMSRNSLLNQNTADTTESTELAGLN